MDNNLLFGETKGLSYPVTVGVTIVGPAHIKRGIPCQDACAYLQLHSDSTIVAIADGLGSALYSEIGASAAVLSSLQYVHDLLSKEDIDTANMQNIVHTCFKYARDRLVSISKENNWELDDLASTLIVIIKEKNRIVVGHIGDGGVVASTKDTFVILSEPAPSEYANVVAPLTMEEWEAELMIQVHALDVASILGFTDGCQSAMLSKTPQGWITNDAFLDAFLSHMRNISTVDDAKTYIKDILESERLSDISEDDKTLVVSLFD
jgi:hypothetical protein